MERIKMEKNFSKNSQDITHRLEILERGAVNRKDFFNFIESKQKQFFSRGEMIQEMIREEN